MAGKNVPPEVQVSKLWSQGRCYWEVVEALCGRDQRESQGHQGHALEGEWGIVAFQSLLCFLFCDVSGFFARPWNSHYNVFPLPQV